MYLTKVVTMEDWRRNKEKGKQMTKKIHFLDKIKSEKWKIIMLGDTYEVSFQWRIMRWGSGIAITSKTRKKEKVKLLL